MGRAIAGLFAGEGAYVWVNYNSSREGALETVESILAAGGRATAVQADVADEAAVRAMLRGIEDECGRLDTLVNNAGWTRRVPHADLDGLTDEIWQRTLAINLLGPFYAIRAAAPLLRRGRTPSIVNIASTGALTGSASSMAYVASKAGLLALTVSLARALAPHIRVNAVVPGLMRTGFASWTEENYAPAEAASPLGRLAGVEDVAQAALYLATALGTTGETISIDSGLARLGPRS